MDEASTVTQHSNCERYISGDRQQRAENAVQQGTCNVRLPKARLGAGVVS